MTKAMSQSSKVFLLLPHILTPGLWLCRDLLTRLIKRELNISGTKLTLEREDWIKWEAHDKEELAQRMRMTVPTLMEMTSFHQWDLYNRAAHEASSGEMLAAVQEEMRHRDGLAYAYAELHEMATRA